MRGETMETRTKKRINWRLAAVLALPVLLIGLFHLLKGDRTVMDRWVFSVLAPAAQGMGRLWSLVPFSGMELIIALFLLTSAGWLIHCGVRLGKERRGEALLRRVLALAAAWLWTWCGLCWLWNVTYYASTFTQRSGLDPQLYSVEELAAATEWFARKAAGLSTQVTRDEKGHFSEDLKDCFRRGPSVYDELTSEFPCLEMKPVEAKPLLCSRLQSILGFTGMYFPFTGEANVNVDAPACLVPATIAHEMAHQRMVASELEANFVGIAACVTSGDVVFRYSGYLMGLIQLCNALYPVAPDLWYDIAGRCFTAELATDWEDNNAYWKALESPVEEAAEEAYDTFLKENDQPLGVRSYGACVDLLVTWHACHGEENVV